MPGGARGDGYAPAVRRNDPSSTLQHRPDPGRRRHQRHHDEAYDGLLQDNGRLDRTEQLRILSVLLPAQNRAAVVRFFLMLTLSVTIAVMGLAANSAAVVIGAMLVAPLMTPIMTFAASVGLGLGRRAVQAAFLVVVGAAWSIALGAVLARLLPSVTIGSELLARTRPDVRDLVVAVAAGTAGAYATARADVSSALPGVAVAVALVPPLAATGILLESHQSVLAEGSLLLFLTNLLAIIVSAIVVMLATRVIPTIRLFFVSPRVAITSIGILVATAAIAVPLTARSIHAASSSRLQEDVSAAVDAWLGNSPLDVVALEIDGSTATVELAGQTEPPPVYELATRLVPVLGPDAEAVVRWDQRAQGTARADSPPVADPTDVARAVVEDWLSGLAADGVQLDLVDLVLTDDRVEVEVSGPAAPPAAPELPNQIATAIGRSVDVRLRWLQSFDPGLGTEPADVRLERIVNAWIGGRASVRLIATSIDGTTVHVDLGADGIPLGLDTLRRVGLAAVDGAVRIDIRILPLVAAPEHSPDTTVPPLD